MPQGDAHSARSGVRGQFRGAGQFRCERHQAHMAMGSFDQTIECCDAGCEEMFWWLHAAFLVREKWTLEVDSERTCATRWRQLGDFVGHAIERAQCGVDRCGDGGGEKCTGSSRCEKLSHGFEGLGRCFHHVVAGCAMDVHVEKCGTERGTAEVESTCADRQLGGFTAGDGIDLAVFNENEWMLVEAGTVPEPLCGHYRLHGNPLLQVNGRVCVRCRCRCRCLSSVCNVAAGPRLLSFCHAKFGVVPDGWRFFDGWSADEPGAEH